MTVIRAVQAQHLLVLLVIFYFRKASFHGSSSCQSWQTCQLLPTHEPMVAQAKVLALVGSSKGFPRNCMTSSHFVQMHAAPCNASSRSAVLGSASFFLISVERVCSWLNGKVTSDVSFQESSGHVLDLAVVAGPPSLKRRIEEKIMSGLDDDGQGENCGVEPPLDDLQLDRDMLINDVTVSDHRLGLGSFGAVFAGMWRGTPVAVKRLHTAADP